MAQCTLAQFTDDINSNRPGRSMMAFSVGKSIFQAETGINYVSEDHKTLNYKANGFVARTDLNGLSNFMNIILLLKRKRFLN